MHMVTIEYWLKNTDPDFDAKRHVAKLIVPDGQSVGNFVGSLCIDKWKMYNVYDEDLNVTERVEHCANEDTISVGDGVTERYWTDREPYEVIEVKSESTIVVRELRARRTDDLGVSDTQDYEYYRNYSAPVKTLRKVKRGKYYVWIEWGHGRGGNTFHIGTARKYYDYCF